MSSKKTLKMKLEAAKFAVNFVRSGMTVGLGSGSTALLAVEELADKVKEGILENIICIPSSEHESPFAEEGRYQ